MSRVATRMWRAASVGIFLTILACGVGPSAAGTLDKLRQDKTLRIAHRDDAPPFSFKDAKGQPAGFMVDLCRAVAGRLTADLDLGELKIVCGLALK